MTRRFVRMFKPRFAALVLAGVKRQTVRPVPKRMPLPGDIMDARQWSGRPYNSPQTRLGEYVIRRVAAVTLGRDWLMLDGVYLSPDSAEKFAANDGFASFSEMLAWFRENHGEGGFEGICIFWT